MHTFIVTSLAAVVGFVLGTSAVCADESQLRAGDKLQITVYNHPEFSGPVVVNDATHVFVPLVGEINAEHMTSHQLGDHIASRLSGFIPHVAVDVQIESSDPSVFIDGGPVAVLPYTPGETLTNAITQLEAPPAQFAGSASGTPSDQSARNLLHGRSDLHRVGVVRNGVSLGTFDIPAMRDTGQPGLGLRPGDTIVLVNKPIHVVVQGEVREPGSAYLDVNEALSDAVTQVGGTLPSATSSVHLTRQGAMQIVALGSPTFSSPGKDGDTVFVPRAPRIGVVGAVDKPGDITLFGDTSLVSAIYNAGGPTKTANLKQVIVIHNGQRSECDVIAAVHGKGATTELADGDTVMVPVGHKVDYSGFWQAVGSLSSVVFALK